MDTTWDKLVRDVTESVRLDLDRDASIHEASHAILARMFGSRIFGLELNDMGGGLTKFSTPANPFQAGAVAVGGAVGAAICGAPTAARISPSDCAIFMAAKKGIDCEFEVECCSLAHEVLQKYKPLVMQLASALLSRRAMDGVEAEKIIDGFDLSQVKHYLFAL